ARPSFPLNLIRAALMETADNATTPDNSYGWGLIDLEQALLWGSNFTADQTFGDAPMTVQFTDMSTIPATSYNWDFGDGGSSTLQNPTHQYMQPGIYDVSLTIATAYGPIVGLKNSFIIAKGDTLSFVSDSAYAGQDVVISVNLINSMPTDRILVPLVFEEVPDITLDSMQLGARTSYFERLRYVTESAATRRYTPELTANIGGGAPPLPPGDGEILKLFFSTNPYTLGGQANLIDSTFNFTYHVSLITEFVNFVPDFNSGTVSTRFVVRGDADGNGAIDITDLTYMVTYFYTLGQAPVTIQSGDINFDLMMNISDLTYLVDYMFNGGPPPPQP
ncbi:MAG: PKD domain-containing protein, partial [bacterium]|nr:PKD domain-containing protein [bacterium]